MQLTISNLNLPVGSSLDSLVENRLVALSESLRIDDAKVVIERRTDASPPYRVHLHISVPGPDLHTERMAFTPVQALSLALKEIESKIKARRTIHLARVKARRTAGSRVGSSSAH
jgi:ribosome-associated translation inhibitor RaiA